MKYNSHQFNFLGRMFSVKFLRVRTVLAGVFSWALLLAPQVQSAPALEYRLSNFELRGYTEAVSSLFEAWEEHSGNTIQPQEKKRVGLKVYTSSGPGLCTSKNLVRAVIGSLVDRGYAPMDIFLIDINGAWMRDSGFLPPLSARDKTFYGHEVQVINSGDYFHPTWYYDSPVPPREHYLPGITPMVQEFVEEDPNAERQLPEDRKSFIPASLVLDVDFWINLPAISDHEMLILNGALVNATLWNASNTLRFFHSPANAPVAVAEMAAIPELRATWSFNIVSLEKYQFIGGPQFNSLYTVSDNLVILSEDPVLVDSYMISLINQWRDRYRFPLIPEEVSMLAYAEQLGVGSRDLSPGRIITVR